MKPIETEVKFLWAAIDLLMQEIQSRGDCSPWLRNSWKDLLNDRNEFLGTLPNCPGCLDCKSQNDIASAPPWPNLCGGTGKCAS